MQFIFEYKPNSEYNYFKYTFLVTMNDKHIVIGIFENELYALVQKGYS